MISAPRCGQSVITPDGIGTIATFQDPEQKAWVKVKLPDDTEETRRYGYRELHKPKKDNLQPDLLHHPQKLTSPKQRAVDVAIRLAEASPSHAEAIRFLECEADLAQAHYDKIESRVERIKRDWRSDPKKIGRPQVPKRDAEALELARGNWDVALQALGVMRNTEVTRQREALEAAFLEWSMDEYKKKSAPIEREVLFNAFKAGAKWGVGSWRPEDNWRKEIEQSDH